MLRPDPVPARSGARALGRGLGACGLVVLGLLLGLFLVGPSPPSGAAERGVEATTGTIWLCRPGVSPDPCAYNEASTSVSGSGATTVSPSPSPSPTAKKFDCFYVYPTVSTEQTDNANLTIQPAERAAAASQASRFSQVCNVWAPMYRQGTVYALNHGRLTAASTSNVAYASLLSGWRDYLAHDNGGRPIVFIGHSQGSAMLIRLLRSQIDPSPRLRRQLVSAIILGGNVQVPTGKRVGGTFQHIPTCSSAQSTGCVIAYSSFGTTPPLASFFGRPGQGVSRQSGQTTRRGQSVACVNPVNFSAASGSLQPYFLTPTANVEGVTVSTPWVSFPGLYTAQCRTAGTATWLQVTATPSSGDPRPLVKASLGPLWGYHLDDVNLSLGNLVQDVATEEAAHR